MEVADDVEDVDEDDEEEEEEASSLKLVDLVEEMAPGICLLCRVVVAEGGKAK